ncbi:MAG: hypothetical protein NW206_07845 [Hyphomonadaceae bacterium]|nr:hypothetical protein [Hyphomonadaceae bacterium]
MKTPAANKTAKRAEHAPRERDFFLDELMTAQPDATREFLREHLRQQAPKPAPKS